jgi:hypothetical protein
VSVLLRQPHGFEGFPQVEVVVDSQHQSIAQGQHGGHPRADLDSAALALESAIDHGDDLIVTAVDQFGDRQVVALGRNVAA